MTIQIRLHCWCNQWTCCFELEMFIHVRVVRRCHSQSQLTFQLWIRTDSVTWWLLQNSQPFSDQLGQVTSSNYSSLDSASRADLWRVCCPIAHCATTRTDSRQFRIPTKTLGAMRSKLRKELFFASSSFFIVRLWFTLSMFEKYALLSLKWSLKWNT